MKAFVDATACSLPALTYTPHFVDLYWEKEDEGMVMMVMVMVMMVMVMVMVMETNIRDSYDSRVTWRSRIQPS